MHVKLFQISEVKGQRNPQVKLTTLTFPGTAVVSTPRPDSIGSDQRSRGSGGVKNQNADIGKTTGHRFSLQGNMYFHS